MTDLKKYNNLAELNEYYNSLLIKYESFEKYIKTIEERIISNQSYLYDVSQSFIDESIKKGPNIFKAYNIINEERFKYIEYLISEFHLSDLYVSYLQLKDEINEINDLVSKMYINEEIPKSIVTKINEEIFREYRLKLETSKNV